MFLGTTRGCSRFLRHPAAQTASVRYSGLLEIHIFTKSSLDNNPFFFLTTAPIAAPVEALLSAATAMHWKDVVLLADEKCSWGDTPADLKGLVLMFADLYGVSGPKRNR